MLALKYLQAHFFQLQFCENQLKFKAAQAFNVFSPLVIFKRLYPCSRKCVRRWPLHLVYDRDFLGRYPCLAGREESGNDLLWAVRSGIWLVLVDHAA